MKSREAARPREVGIAGFGCVRAPMRTMAAAALLYVALACAWQAAATASGTLGTADWQLHTNSGDSTRRLLQEQQLATGASVSAHDAITSAVLNATKDGGFLVVRAHRQTRPPAARWLQRQLQPARAAAAPAQLLCRLPAHAALPAARPAVRPRRCLLARLMPARHSQPEVLHLRRCGAGAPATRPLESLPAPRRRAACRSACPVATSR